MIKSDIRRYIVTGLLAVGLWMLTVLAGQWRSGGLQLPTWESYISLVIIVVAAMAYAYRANNKLH